MKSPYGYWQFEIPSTEPGLSLEKPPFRHWQGGFFRVFNASHYKLSYGRHDHFGAESIEL